MPVFLISQMTRLIHLEQGYWVKSDAGVWRFVMEPEYLGEALLLRENETIEDLMTLVRVRLELPAETPVALTYQFPEWMRIPNGPHPQPVNLLENRDVEVMMSIREFNDVLILYVTSGPLKVARYQFLCRSPFTVCNTAFLGEGVSEEQHRRAIRGEITP